MIAKTVVYNYNKTPAQAFTPPAEKNRRKVGIYVQLLRQGTWKVAI